MTENWRWWRSPAARKSYGHAAGLHEKGWNPGISPLVLIGHGDCPEKAELLKSMVQKEFPNAEIFTTPIGPIIGSHTGPGMLALIYWGTNR
ncbi:MAG: DegV family protein [Lachnospiraceae bacterium]